MIPNISSIAGGKVKWATIACTRWSLVHCCGQLAPVETLHCQGPGQCGKCACRLGMPHVHLKETHAHMNLKHVVMALLKKSSMLFWAFCWLVQFDFLWIG
jgi:hypothetical protein